MKYKCVHVGNFEVSIIVKNLMDNLLQLFGFRIELNKKTFKILIQKFKYCYLISDHYIIFF